MYWFHFVLYHTKQYKLVPAQAGIKTGTPRDTLAPCPWTCSFGWCLAEGYRNGDQRRPMGPWLGKDFSLAFLYIISFLFQIGLKISMTCYITFVLAGVSLLYLCVYFVCVFFICFIFLFYFTCVYVFVCLEHDFYNNNNNSIALRVVP